MYELGHNFRQLRSNIIFDAIGGLGHNGGIRFGGNRHGGNNEDVSQNLLDRLAEIDMKANEKPL